MDGLFIPFHENLILEQFAGLHDKNGKDLDWWEGDLLREDGGKIMEIVYEDGCFWGVWVKHRENKTSLHVLLGWIDAIEKIGNIHENGDLLNDTDEQTHTS